ncbi:hypothetical protein BABINDRAFT_117858 [Babjeviella inositovora NRRL Y-12698]|uniref:ZIP zinc/iron transport family n=1 Tax=Babjeviella inositovora NRRL Y-12698 TaxID=984486 RepID=A0A1E3QIT0_9ASCO|nr:uncharacterized protein BABINDRAFT_117858 [Babjeviella inositovora NRRL Y-12698]ODQ76897.1 hypothetical protein BABINDRAFT_117858 [Babjeviella inositovora NRRL Y-12698]
MSFQVVGVNHQKHSHTHSDVCESANDFDGTNWGARISSVFVVLMTSAIGAYLPILCSKYSFIRLPPSVFFVAKFFGSGVIIATAFIHLLAHAQASFSHGCLGGTFLEYPWAFAIAMMTLFVLFFAELMVYRFVEHKIGLNSHSHFGDVGLLTQDDKDTDSVLGSPKDDGAFTQQTTEPESANPYPSHFSHAKHHQDPEVMGTPAVEAEKENYYGHLVSVFVLEFGIIFHSVFIGLSLAVAGEGFVALYCVIVFHQMFEGLGLGTRIATTPWPKNVKWTPWLLCGAYALCTPISIAIGLGVRHSYPPQSRTSLITSGVFDSISAGILIYTGLVELMAHEFMYSDEFKGKGGLKRVIYAYVVMCFGAGIMALLGKWA